MTEEIVKDKEHVEDVVVDPVEEQAKEQGWVTKDEWVAQGKDEKEHRSAKEFVDRGELYRSIHSTKRELQQTRAALDSLAKHHQFVYNKAYQDAMQELKLERRAALKDGNTEAVEAIEEDMAKLDTEHKEKTQAFVQEQNAARQGPPPELDAWMTRNQWYTNDEELRDEADAIGMIYLRKGGDKTKLLNHVETKMKQKFPEKFGGKKVAPNAVSSVDRTNKRAPSGPEAELSELETKIMNDLVKSGVMTKEQYIKELKGAK